MQATVLAAYRVVIGFLFACHGSSALFGAPLAAMRFRGAVGQWPGWWGGLIELVGGVLIVGGAAFRPAVFLCSGTMAYAYFTVHAHKGLFPIVNGGELAALYCWSFFVLVFLGPGAFALDGLWRRRLTRGRRRGGASAEPIRVDS